MALQQGETEAQWGSLQGCGDKADATSRSETATAVYSQHVIDGTNMLVSVVSGKEVFQYSSPGRVNTHELRRLSSPGSLDSWLEEHITQIQCRATAAPGAAGAWEVMHKRAAS